MAGTIYNFVRLYSRHMSILRGAKPSVILATTSSSCSRLTQLSPRSLAHVHWFGTSPSLATDLAETEHEKEIITSDYKEISVTRRAGALKILLNRPKIYNAFNNQMFEEVCHALFQAGKDESVSFVVITGAGKYFSSGKELAGFSLDNPIAIGGPEGEFISAFINFPKPLVAAVNGPAIGIGVTSLALCDFVYAANSATFQAPFTKLGVTPESCSSLLFPQIMGPAKANELLLLGRKFTAQEAYESNLVAQVFPEDQFQEKIEEVVSKLAKLPPQALMKSKQLLRDVQRDKMEKARVTETKLFIERMSTDECKKAFLELKQFMAKGQS